MGGEGETSRHLIMFGTQVFQEQNLTDDLRSRVGGVVSETNFKFFLQFVSWTAVYCTFILIFMANFVKERVSHDCLTLHFAAHLCS